MSKRPYVVYWNNIPSPYMVDRFNALADQGIFEFEAWFSGRIQSERSWNVDESTWRFRYRYIPTLRIGKHAFHIPLYLLGREVPDVFVSLYAEPSFVVGWLLAKSRGAKTVFRVLATYDSWVARHPIKNALKRYLFSRVDAIETPGRDGKQFAVACGARPDRVFLATHTVNMSVLQDGLEKAVGRRNEFRAELGIEGTAFIYVGRLWAGKGVSVLIEAFEQLQRKAKEPVTLLLVGDGPDEQELKRVCAARRLRNVIFAGFKQKGVLPKYYNAADVFVFPTLGDPYGLVVDEAMACSLPIISSMAAGEIESRVEEGVNGFLVPAGDSVTLTDRMLRFVGDPSLRKKMGRVSQNKVRNHTPERWASDFQKIVSAVLGG